MYSLCIGDTADREMAVFSQTEIKISKMLLSVAKYTLAVVNVPGRTARINTALGWWLA